MTLRNLAKQALLAPFGVFSGPRTTKRISLTFDDGPHPEFTVPVSRALHDAGVRATFFLVGQQMQRYPEIVAQLRAHDHEISSHSMTHPEMKDLPKAKLVDEVNAMYEIKLADGSAAIPNNFFRPPKGVVTPSLLRHCYGERLKLIFWNRDPEDYKAASASEILQYFKTDPLQSGDIVLMHDKNHHTVQAIPQLLAMLAVQNLTAVTISELLTRVEKKEAQAKPN
jgi:peptidoglycan-N-acetylglucosamine deacetylase